MFLKFIDAKEVQSLNVLPKADILELLKIDKSINSNEEQP